MKLIDNFELQIMNDLMELRSMSAWLHKTCENLAVPESVAKDIDLCANEAVANIILYAYEDHEQHQINIRLELKKNQELSVTIQDDGNPFDPFKAILPEFYDKIGDVQIGGMGIQLMRSLANECRYCRLNGKNIVTLCFHLCQTASSSVQNENSPLLNCSNY
jgi:anti-sigma regulatory factor (Ser/Thr protein kinase)